MTRTIRRKPIAGAIAMLALALGLFAVAPVTAGAAQACVVGSDYANTMQLTANPSTTTPGSTVVITGTGYPKNCELTVYVDGNSIGTATTDGNGTFTINWHVPTNAKAGDHVISTNVSNISKTANVQVVLTHGTGTGNGNGTGGGNGSSILPKTGSDVLPFLGGGVALLVLGSLLVLGTRKRTTHRA